MKRLALILLVVAACGESTGLSTAGTNFSVTNRSGDPATVVLYQNDWDALNQAWIENPTPAYSITVQPGVCTDVLLDFQFVTGVVALPAGTVSLSVFGLAQTNTWTTTIIIDGGVHRSARLRGDGCQ